MINNVSQRVLEALGRYKFLSLSQMLRIGIGTVSKRYLREQIKFLKDRKRPFIGVIEFGAYTQVVGGRMEYIYYLKPFGAQVLQDLEISPEWIRTPIGKPQLASLYAHRKL